MQQPPAGGGYQGDGGQSITCQICGAASPGGTRQCPRCHANLVAPPASARPANGAAGAAEESVRCQMCGGVSTASAAVCTVCGANLVPGSDAPVGAGVGIGEEAVVDDEGRHCACGAVNPLTVPTCMVCGARLIAPVTYQMIGTLMPAIQIDLLPGQRVYGQTSCLGWMTESVQMRTLAKGSPWRLLGRVASGMTMLVSQFEAPQQAGVVAFTPTLPGRIMPLELSPSMGYILQPGAFLAAQDSVTLHAFFTRNIGAGLFGGEGFILQRLSGSGVAFIQIGGEMVGYELAAGEVLLVDPGSIACFEQSVRFSVRLVKGITNIVFNQGLFLAELRGPGRVWVETMPMSRLIAGIAARYPAAGGGMGNVAAGIASAFVPG